MEKGSAVAACRRGLRSLLACAVFLSLQHATAACGEGARADAAFEQSFEDQIPGQMPKGWAVTWGEAKDNVIGISNLAAANGQRALMIDRSVGEHDAGFKLSRNVPNPGSGWCLFQCCVRIDGAATNSRVTIEVGPPHPNPGVKVSFSLRGWGPTIHLYPNVRGGTWTENWEAKRVMANWDKDVWCRLSLAFPVAAEAKEAFGSVEVEGAHGAWKPVSSETRVPATPTGKTAPWSISIISECRGSVVFFDAFRLAPCAERPPLPAAKHE